LSSLCWDKMGKKVLVTGSNGFIGSHLVKRLLKDDCCVNCMVRKTSNLKWINGHPVSFVCGDFCQKATLEDAVIGVDEIYHLGGAVRVADNKAFYRINSEGTKNLVQAVIEFNPGLKKFVYVSSQAAWGPEGAGPVSHYGKSKREAEEWVKELDCWSIVRPGAVYGPRDKDFLPVFEMAMKGIFLKPFKAGKLSFIHVDDCVEGILKAEIKKESFLHDNNRYEWEEVAEILENVINKKVYCLTIPRTVLKIVGLAGTVAGRVSGTPVLLNSDKVNEMLGGDWVMPESPVDSMYNLKAGFKDTFEWYIKEGWIEI